MLDDILAAPTWEDFKESIYALHQRIFASTKNKFLVQIMGSILDDRRAVLFDGQRYRQAGAAAGPPADPQGARSAIVDAIVARNAQAGGGAGVRPPDADAGDDQHLAVARRSARRDPPPAAM